MKNLVMIIVLGFMFIGCSASEGMGGGYQPLPDTNGNVIETNTNDIVVETNTNGNEDTVPNTDVTEEEFFQTTLNSLYRDIDDAYSFIITLYYDKRTAYFNRKYNEFIRYEYINTVPTGYFENDIKVELFQDYIEVYTNDIYIRRYFKKS